ncbi:hypothetical protein EF847_17190 [Actinobacteria bacterium YIM 96077]|uniref:Cytochrome P450 n=1 Tax=Phytoactinopolyspora halophila TaxID=1981511 RepID=A0A329QD59_9ACTN|nr:hypothetical protein [Phytoactinopolyspora halophila]AYY14174.1 hypothetical protein EF847_17190 [Actinobacteria bacterium YIM 96077]RAW10234.1 hypothetical protein DPM12_19315 [Phytoactinopolyspora halophila]
MRITTHSGIWAVLTDPRFVVPPVPDDGPPATMRWLRAHVARFSSGEDHRRRRAQAAGALASLDGIALRRDAARRTATRWEGEDDTEAVVAGTLAAAFGLTVDVADIVAAARAYHPQVEASPEVDQAVARLVDAFGGRADEAAAARVGLLMQGTLPTAGLVENAMRELRGRPCSAESTDATLAETLHHDPPVRVTRRLATAPARIGGADVPPGVVVELDLATGNQDPAVLVDRFAFGAGEHACPGAAYAQAIAAGIIDELAARAGGRSSDP